MKPTGATKEATVTVIELRNKLRALDYNAKVVNGECFDIDQNGRTHYLSRTEAEALAKAGAGINLMDYAERRGLNFWYSFIRPATTSPGEREG